MDEGREKWEMMLFLTDIGRKKAQFSIARETNGKSEKRSPFFLSHRGCCMFLFMFLKLKWTVSNVKGETKEKWTTDRPTKWVYHKQFSFFVGKTRQFRLSLGPQKGNFTVRKRQKNRRRAATRGKMFIPTDWNFSAHEFLLNVGHDTHRHSSREWAECSNLHSKKYY